MLCVILFHMGNFEAGFCVNHKAVGGNTDINVNEL